MPISDAIRHHHSGVLSAAHTEDGRWRNLRERPHWIKLSMSDKTGLHGLRDSSCPKCGRTNPLRIVYGIPSPEPLDAAEMADIALGGCCIYDDSPDWECRFCGYRFRSAD